MTAGPVAYSSNSFTTNAPPWHRRRDEGEREEESLESYSYAKGFISQSVRQSPGEFAVSV